MKIDEMIDNLRKAEHQELIDALNANGGFYEWPDLFSEDDEEDEDEDDDCCNPTVTVYYGDGEWHDIEVQRIDLIKDSLLHIIVTGRDWTNDCDNEFKEEVYAGEIILGDCHNLVEHMK